jgi:PAP2 superfamily protein
MRKALTLVTALALALGATTVAWMGAASATDRARGPSSRGSRASGAIVVDWNQELLRIVRAPAAEPATVHPTRNFAILQAAIYDAVVSITHDAPPYLFTVRASDDARPDAAAATAAHDTLAGLYPAMKPELDRLLTTELSAVPDGAEKQEGVRVGALTSELLLALRAHDRSEVTPTPLPSATRPGQFRPMPPKFAPAVFTHWDGVTPFVLNNDGQFRPAPPPTLSSGAYASSFSEVKSVGRDSSTTRSADETIQAKFWAAPIWNYWNQIADDAVLAHHTDLPQAARLFADMDLSFADGAISFYDAKYHYDLWRPITAIREAATDGNPATIADPNWTPLAATPADPSYPGAHSVISAAGATVLSTFFGDHENITVSSEVLPGVVRHFESYRAAAREAGLSRIFAGVHTRLDHNAGLRLGRDVADYVLAQNDVG